MKKLCAVLLAAAAMLSACGQQESSHKQDFSGITLSVITSFDETDGNREAYLEAIKQFEEETGAVVNDNSSKSDEAWKQDIIGRFEAGDMPDVLFFFKNMPYISDKCVSVDTIRESFPTYAESISAAVLNDMKEEDGKVYAVPVTGFWEGMFINKSLFENNGIAVPETFDELLETVERFRELSIVPIAASLSGEPHYLFEFLLYNRNGPAGHRQTLPLAEDGSLERWAQGLNDFRVLYEKGAFQDDLDITHAEALELFQRKEAAMFVDGSWRVGSITDKDDVIVIPFPGTDARKTTDLLGGFSMGFYITEKGWGEQREASVAFVEAMCSAEAVARFNVNGAASPVASAGASGDSELLKSIMKMNGEATAFIPAVQDNFVTGARDALFKDIKAIALGEKTSVEAVEQFITLSGQE